MIIWKGLGFLGALIPFVFILLSNSLLGSEVVGWAILTSAVPVWWLGRNFYKRPAEMMLDSKTQQNVLVKPEHTLFWVELDYWAIMLVVFGIPFLLPERLISFSMQIAMVFIACIFFGRIGYIFYQKYLKKDNSKESNPANNFEASVANQGKTKDKLSKFSAKSSNKKKLSRMQSSENTIDKNKGLPASELKKKAFYAQMRKDREAPKKFDASQHSNYFPGNAKMPFIPPSAILNKDTATEEE